jgi:beta-N-acetylhexosaminidase
MTDSQLAAQVIMAGIDADSSAGRGLSDSEARRLRDVPAGAVMLFGKNLKGSRGQIAAMNRAVSDTITEACGVAPFIAVDHEGGKVQRFGDKAVRLPSPLSYLDTTLDEDIFRKIYDDARGAASDIHSLGITMNLAPVAEVLTPENAPFLGERAYGRDADFVSGAASSFVRAMQKEGVACVVKHFPGNSGADPHTGKSTINAMGDALAAMVEPFARVIRDANPAAVMVSHAVVSEWDKTQAASLSPVAMTVELREKLGFQGIILADDFSMGAIRGESEKLKTEDAAVASLAAGADMVMAWPANLRNMHRAILKAMRDGTLSRALMEEKAGRIIGRKSW